ncbi:IS5 family transposase [Cutibacterium acnes]
MPTQTSFAELEYISKKKQTRRERFLAQIEAATPWAQLVAVIEPHYPKGNRGRPPIGLERMLRMYIAQNCFGLSDEGIEDALYDSQAIRRFVGIDLGREAAPDATTLLKFRRLLEENNLTAAIFEAINAHLAKRGLLMRQGTIVDATLIAAPSSTKNSTGERDPEMHQTKKGNQWHFGMKAHVGVDADSGLVHTVVGTAANVNDVTQAHHLLHGKETDVFGDAGYQGADKREENQGKQLSWHIAMRPGKRKALPETPWGVVMDKLEQVKARIRAKGEHAFHVIKNLFHHRKTRYRGLEKNTKQLYTLFGLANLVLARRWLLAPQGPSAS